MGSNQLYFPVDGRIAIAQIIEFVIRPDSVSNEAPIAAKLLRLISGFQRSG